MTDVTISCGIFRFCKGFRQPETQSNVANVEINRVVYTTVWEK